MSYCDLHHVRFVQNMFACGDVQVLHEWRGLVIPSSVSHGTLCPGAVKCMYLPNELRHTADDIVHSVKPSFQVCGSEVTCAATGTRMPLPYCWCRPWLLQTKQYTTLLDRLRAVYHAASDVRPPLGLPSTSAFDALHRPVRNVSRNTSTECAIAVCVHSSPCKAACAEQVVIHPLDA